MKTLNVIVPSRGRPENIARLINAMDSTTDHINTQLTVVVDADDPVAPDYMRLLGGANGLQWLHFVVNDQWQKLGPILNGVTASQTVVSSHIAFLGDDHVPRTAHWDRDLVESLQGRPGVAYGNDLFQGPNLPTAVVISSDIIRVLGYMCPPGLVHLFLDNFWKELGQKVHNLQYLPEVIIEHLHPLAQKAGWTEAYAWTCSDQLMQEDGLRYAQFLYGRWPGDLLRLQYALEGHLS